MITAPFIIINILLEKVNGYPFVPYWFRLNPDQYTEIARVGYVPQT